MQVVSLQKKEVSTFPIFGISTKLVNCIFVERRSENSRKNLLNKIHERQIQYFNKKAFIPLLTNPKGSATCGRNILKFKKGTFANLLPIIQILFLLTKKENAIWLRAVKIYF